MVKRCPEHCGSIDVDIVRRTDQGKAPGLRKKERPGTDIIHHRAGREEHALVFKGAIELLCELRKCQVIECQTNSILVAVAGEVEIPATTRFEFIDCFAKLPGGSQVDIFRFGAAQSQRSRKHLAFTFIGLSSLRPSDSMMKTRGSVRAAMV